jgi:hypothetical protein
MKIQQILPIFFLLNVLLILNCNAQRNTFTFTYTPAITKLAIKNFPNYTFLSSWNIYFESKKNNMPAYGFNAGFYYSYQLNKLSIGVGMLYSELSQQSGLYYQWIGRQDYTENYGGTNYVMTYSGIEFPLSFKYLIKQKKSINFNLEFGLSFNAMLEFRTQSYIVTKNDGIYRNGANTTIIAGVEDNFELIKFRILHAPPEMIRIASWIGLSIERILTKNLSLSMTPTLKYYSNTLKQANNNSSLDADAFLFGTQINLNLKF